MLGKNVITKIALGVAAIAFVFSLITLIRSIIIGSGVLFAVIQIIGTLIIVSICAVMLYVLRTEENDEDADDENTGDDDDPADSEAQTDEEPETESDAPDAPEPKTAADKYDLTDFE